MPCCWAACWLTKQAVRRAPVSFGRVVLHPRLHQVPRRCRRRRAQTAHHPACDVQPEAFLLPVSFCKLLERIV